MSSSRHETGTSTIHLELERTVAEFLGVDDAISVGMGFATNTLNLPGDSHLTPGSIPLKQP